METFRIQIGHQSPMIGAKWCRPVGWVPANEIPGSKFTDGSWRDHGRETAGVVYFTPLEEGEEVDVPIEDLRVAACGEWQLLGEVVPAASGGKSSH